MKARKVWLCCCLLFCVYCLSLLVEESYQVTYWADDGGKDEDERLHFLACLALKTLPLNRTEADLHELRAALYDHLLQRLPAGSEKSELILNRTSDHFAIMRNSACVILNNRSELVHFYKWLPSRAVSFAIKENTCDWVKMNDAREKFDQLIVFNEGPPYSNCSRNFSRFHCLNDCFKRRFRMSEYIYFADENGPIYVNEKKNSTIRSHENRCFRECSKSNCKLVYLNPNEVSEEEAENVVRFNARPMISPFDFSIQLAGLISLTLNASFSRLLAIAIRFASSKLVGAREEERLRSALVYLKHMLLLVGLLCCSYLFVRMIADFRDKVANPMRKETTRNLMRPETLRLAVCIPLDFLLLLDDDDDDRYESMSMWELEKATDGALNSTIDRITLDFLDKSVEIRWEVQPKVLFKTGQYLERCFCLAIYPDEAHYEILLSISKLKIQFRHSMVYSLFLLNENENLNADSFAFTGRNAFLKRIAKRSRLNGKCVEEWDRVADPPIRNCTTRQNCVERCTVRRLINEHRRVPTGALQAVLVVDKDEFNQSEWAAAYFDDSYEVDERPAAERCLKQVPPAKACTESRIEASVQIRQPDDDIKKMDLYYNVIRSVEDQPSHYKLMLDLLNVLSIFFGLNVFGLLKMIRLFVEARWKIGRNSALALVYLAGLVGFGCHSYHIIEIMNGELSFAQHYQMASSLRMPEIFLCFDYDMSLIGENRTLTGNDLEQLTGSLNAEKVFNWIAYRDYRNKWIEWRSNDSTSQFQIETLYFLFQKCFSLKFELAYDLKQFYFLDTGEVLKLKFNWPFIRDAGTVHFMTHRTNTMQFSKILKINKFELGGKGWISFQYSISQELFLMSFEDRFSLIRNFFSCPLSLFFEHQNFDDINDVNSYLAGLLRDFKKAHGRATLNLPLRKPLFDLPIDNALFENYSAERFERDQYAPVSSNYQREYAINFLNLNQKFYKTDLPFANETEPDLSFSLIHFKKIVVANNTENYAKLILNFLNAFSTWFSFKLLNVPLHTLAVKRSLLRLRNGLQNVRRRFAVVLERKRESTRQASSD